MTPDRMVIDEARRTFTYLNLYGYLTDAVIVNRVFPEQVGDYFGAWRERQQEERGVEAAFAPVPVLPAPFFGEEVVWPATLDRLGDALEARATLRRSCTARHRAARPSATAARACASTCRSRRRGRSR